MSGYFLNPAQDLDTSVEVGKEGYSAVYPEPDTEVLYTVCLVANNSDTETCPLIAHNVSNCCVCGSPDCKRALGGGVNTSLGLTPADANWPGVPSCIVLSELPLTLDCFAQRLSGEVTSLRQFTGSILYYDSPAPTSETSSAIGDDQKFIIALSIACVAVACNIVCCVIICMLLALLRCRKRQKNVQSVSDPPNVDRQLGLGEKDGVAASEFNLVYSCVCICTYVCFSQIPPPALYLSFCTFISIARFSGNIEEFEAKPVDYVIVDRLVHKMAKKWEKIGIQLNQGHLVDNLRQPNYDAQSNCSQVIRAAIEEGHLRNYKVLLDILRSDGVGLSEVANELFQAVVDESRSEREQEQQPIAADDSQPPSSSSTPTDDTRALLTSLP